MEQGWKVGERNLLGWSGERNLLGWSGGTSGRTESRVGRKDGGPVLEAVGVAALGAASKEELAGPIGWGVGSNPHL